MPEGEDRGAGREILLANMIESAQWQRALDISNELLSEEPDNPKWHQAAGQATLHLDDLSAARKHLGAALAIAPDDPFTHYLIAHALRLAGENEEAEGSVMRAIELDPDEADYWTELGWLSFERRDFESAQRCADKARKLDPESIRAATLSAAADSQLADGTRGDPEAQVRALEEVLALDPENDAALHNIGVVYFNEVGDYRAAERHFRRALAINPDEPLYQKNLKRSLRRQDPLLRLLYAPWHAVVGVVEFFDWAWQTRWPLFFAIPLSPFLLLGTLILFAFWLLVLWPPAAAYEYLGRPERRATSGELPTPGEGDHFVHRWPKIARFALFLAAFTTFWIVVITAFKALAFRRTLIYLLAGMLAAWIALALFAYGRELRLRRDHRKRHREIDLLE